MYIAVIDADLIGRQRHRFPNLCCMKISGYHKKYGDTVILKTDYDNLQIFDKVYIAKVFTDTPMPTGWFNPLDLPNVEFGGTGFFYDQAPPLPDIIEHCMPDYHLYDDWIVDKTDGVKNFTDYSIGYLTRGCFRHCSFCVNRRCNEVKYHSPLSEFLDRTRKKICLLDDNFLGDIDDRLFLLERLIDTGKPFVFKQGLDIRLMDDDVLQLLLTARYDGDYLFAFDDISDADIIESELRHMRIFTNRNITFYVLCGYDAKNEYNADFWHRDLISLFQRIVILMRYNAFPYVMRFKMVYSDPTLAGIYSTIASWCNIKRCFKKLTLSEFIQRDRSCQRHIATMLKLFPDTKEFINIRWRQNND